MAAHKHALQRKLLDGLRYLLKEQLKLNQPEASDGWITEDALWLVSKTVSDKLRAHLLSLGVDGIPASNTAVFNVLQDHGMLQPTPDGKAVWRATVTSTTGWSHSFTLLRLAPALIWESGERPAPFAGSGNRRDTGTQQCRCLGALAGNDGKASHRRSRVPSMGGRRRRDSGSLACRTSRTRCHGGPAGDGRNRRFACSPTGCGSRLGDAPAAGPQTPPPTSMVPVPSSAPVPTSSSAQPSGEHFMAWLKQGIATRRLVINDAKALVHTVGDTAYLVSPGYSNATHKNTPRSGLSPSRRTSRIGNGYKSASSACNCIAKAQGPEHLDVRCHRPQEVPPPVWLSIARCSAPVRRATTEQSLLVTSRNRRLKSRPKMRRGGPIRNGANQNVDIA